jgi:hypothetical protein
MPIRRGAFNNIEAEVIRDYLETIRPAVTELIVVDGSPDDVFRLHDDMWSQVCRHERVDRRFGCLNDKVNGVQTGVRMAGNDKIILADDDIRYAPADIQQMDRLLDRFEVVRPQNYFPFGVGRVSDLSLTKQGNLEVRAGLPWARMEAARMLINRATLRTADYPGTCAFKRQVFLRGTGYDGDVLFDNEELIRHLARSGAQILYANDFFIRKRPPTFRKWLEQRPRQAYEDFGLRAKTAVFTLLPVLIAAIALLFGPKAMLLALAFVVISVIGLAFIGRSRGTAQSYFPIHICLFAPLWVFERSFSTYWAFYWYFRRGGYPFGDRLLQKGIGRDWIEGGKIASEAVAGARGQNE